LARTYSSAPLFTNGWNLLRLFPEISVPAGAAGDALWLVDLVALVTTVAELPGLVAAPPEG